MKKTFPILFLFVTASCIAQVDTRIDSSFYALSTHLSARDSQQVHIYHFCLADSGTFHRMDSLHAKYVIIQGSLCTNYFEAFEYYFNDADSTPCAFYEQDYFEIREQLKYDKPYQEVRENLLTNKTISRRHCKLFQTAYYGHIKYNRAHYKGTILYRLNRYEFVTIIDNETGKVETQVSLPPRHRIFIMRLKCSYF